MMLRFIILTFTLCLCLFRLSEAAVVYTDIADVTVYANQQYPVDFDGDGIPELTLGQNTDPSETDIHVQMDNINSRVITGASGFTNAAMLDENNTIDASLPSTAFFSYLGVWNSGVVNSFYKWSTGATEKYLGVLFDWGSTRHYAWIKLSAAPDNSSFTIHSFAYESVSDASIVTGVFVLPVQWLEFKLEKMQQGAELVWATAEEKNNDRFEVMRSIDGKSFTTIAIVKGMGNTAYVHTYHAWDNALVEGTVYYKIVQYDFDGQSSSSAVLKAEFSPLGEAKVYPNPSSEEFNLLINYSDNVRIEVTDMMGEVVVARVSMVGESSLSFGAELESGSYLLKVMDGNVVLLNQLLIKE